MKKTKKKPLVTIRAEDIDFRGAKSIADAKVKKASLEISGPDLVLLCQARVLARALKDIDEAFLQMDGVFFNPATALDLEDEIRDKIVSLLQAMKLGA